MTPARADRLAARARSRRDNGLRGLRARRAWNRLLRAGDRGDPAVAREAWLTLLRDPDDELWAALCRWEDPASVTEELCAEATAPRWDAAKRAALAGLCVRQGLAPRDAVQRAGFFALTGQQEQRRALDPDGSLLTAAYQAADRLTRSALREALAGAGDQDVVRVVAGAAAGAGSQVVGMTAEERGYLCEQLDRRRDWAGLWRLAQELPVADAATAARLIDGRWRPDGQRGRDLYCLLTRYDGEAVRTARAKLTVPIHMAVPGKVIAGALSANGHRVAAATIGPEEPDYMRPRSATISVFDLPRGTLVMRYTMPLTGRWYGLVYAGKTLIAMDSRDWRFPQLGDPSYECLLYRCPDDQPMELAFRERTGRHAGFTSIAARRHGFVLGGHDSSGLIFSFHHPDGSRFARKNVSLENNSLYYSLASDIGSGRLAAVTDVGSKIILLDAARARRLSVIASHVADIRESLCFHGPDHVIAVTLAKASRGIYGIGRWQVGDPSGSLSLRNGPMIVHGFWGEQDTPRSLVLVAARDEVCVMTYKAGVSYLNATSLEETRGKRELTGMTGTALWSSADNSCHALGGDGFVYTVTRESLALQGMADRPQAAWVPGDLPATRKAAALMRHYPGAEPLYDLLLGCLENRFGVELAIGRPRPTAFNDDIALSYGEVR